MMNTFTGTQKLSKTVNELFGDTDSKAIARLLTQPNSGIPEIFVGDERKPSSSHLNLGYVLDYIKTRAPYSPLNEILLGRTDCTKRIGQIDLPSSHLKDNYFNLNQKNGVNLVAFLAGTMELCYEAACELPACSERLARLSSDKDSGKPVQDRDLFFAAEDFEVLQTLVSMIPEIKALGELVFSSISRNTTSTLSSDENYADLVKTFESFYQKSLIEIFEQKVCESVFSLKAKNSDFTIPVFPNQESSVVSEDSPEFIAAKVACQNLAASKDLKKFTFTPRIKTEKFVGCGTIEILGKPAPVF